MSAQTDSEIDKLFAKLLTPSPSANAGADSQSQMSVHDLFASLSKGSISAAQHVPLPQPTSTPVVEPPPQTGIALLNSIFASALPPGPSSVVAQPLPSQPEEIVIVSPKPTSSALPQILNQDVISSLLGLTPDSRASSAAPSSVGSRRSAHQRYEGDNELSEGDQTSDGEPGKYNAYSGARSMNGIPTVTIPQTPDSDSEEALESASRSRRVPGDVTPRPPAGGTRLPPTSPPQFQHTAAPNGNSNDKAHSNGTFVPSPAPATTLRQRPLVPFEANSDLWPYPRAPLDDRSYENDDVVELDFSDTRALSDPAIFSTRLKEKKEKKDKGKKSRKEREKNKEREQAEIEKGWDLPAQAQVQPPYLAVATGPVAEAAKPKATEEKVTAMNGAAVNGAVAFRPTPNGALHGVAAKEAILGALLTKGPAQASIRRDDFVRELLGLIHVSNGFALLLIYVC